MLPSGEQVVLSDGRQEATICEVGATLRRYDALGRPVCWGFGEDEFSTGGRGQVLAPWPNRLEDGRYEHGGVTAQAALDEPERRNAIHGLVRWLPWRMERRSAVLVRARCTIPAQPAYPFSVRLELDYELEPTGLTVRLAAENVGTASAPFGVGFHGYLDAGGMVDACKVQLPAHRHLLVDDRLLPVGDEPVAGSVLDGLCGDEPGVVGDRVLDDCCTDLVTGPDGRWRARFVPARAEDASAVWADARFGWLMAFTGDTLRPGERRRALALEPMTCPANALRSRVGLAVLEPGERLSLSWGIAPDRLA